MIHIAPATSHDSTLLTTLSRQTFVDAFGKDNDEADLKAYVEQAFSEPTIRQELSDPNASFYIAYQDDNPIGYLKLRRGKVPDQLQDQWALELQRIYVHQYALGQGVGARLMQTAIDYAQKCHYQVLWLGVWEHNPSAIAFYQKWGFKKFGSHTFMIGQDAQTDWLMQKQLVEEYNPAQQ